ncbi:MAG: hydrogenase expression/formation protein HypE [Candidatus Eisenbacteria bacterium]|uniref:Hydrogenase expression/formation protein HypE n=1 Tax=Eiseniibacteriota bacterium TaxID=2212470 RepID=A0A948W2Y4_UNCEI|nr:hydrogenase expression/formation protein HypE [Candidatus Eisenbacteria bacterium]MBU2690487.1 hydrogenase expression/formation protein HypE [Candidatus Eisenbacteria bacterium]
MTHELVRDVFVAHLDNPFLSTLSDAVVLPELTAGCRPALTTDAFVVDPAVFPGGDVGYLSVCGTINDLAVAGAKPLYLTWALILEEGADGELLEVCAKGASRAAEEAGVLIVAGDTKVVPHGRGDKIYITTAGLGEIPMERHVGDDRIAVGDAILVTGSIGEHGATIMACRHHLSGDNLKSDCAPLNHLLESLFRAELEIHSMHDPTRGGILTTCHEVAGRTGLRISLEEELIPVRPEVQAVCELLGLDPLSVPCEGRALIWCPAEQADPILNLLRQHPLGEGAVRIGMMAPLDPGKAPVILTNAYGADRPLDLLAGSDLPRIC